MSDADYKEVRFDIYCSTCKYKDLDEKFNPCNECLDDHMIPNSCKPIKWEEANK